MSFIDNIRSSIVGTRPVSFNTSPLKKGALIEQGPDPFSYQAFKDLLQQIRYCENKILTYLNTNYYYDGGVKEQNLDIARDMTEGINYLSGLIGRFKPDKSGKKWFENTIKELAEEEENLVDEDEKKGRNSKSKKASTIDRLVDQDESLSPRKKAAINRQSSQISPMMMITPQKYQLGQGSEEFDFKSQFLQPDHLSYFIDQYSKHAEILNISNKFNQFEEFLIQTQLRIQNDHFNLNKDFNEVYVDCTTQIDQSMRELLRGNPNVLSDPKINELMFQYILKFYYLETVSKKISADLEKMIECSYLTQEKLNENCRIILDLQERIPKDLQHLLKDQITEIQAYYQQQDYLVMVDEQLQQDIKAQKIEDRNNKFKMQSQKQWEIKQQYLQKKEEVRASMRITKGDNAMSPKKYKQIKDELEMVKSLAVDISRGIVSVQQLCPPNFQLSKSNTYTQFDIFNHMAFNLIPIQGNTYIGVEGGQGKIEIINNADYTHVATLDVSVENQSNFLYYGIDMPDRVFIGNKNKLFEFTLNDPYAVSKFNKESTLTLKGFGNTTIKHTNKPPEDEAEYFLVGQISGYVQMISYGGLQKNSMTKKHTEIVMTGQLKSAASIQDIKRSLRSIENDEKGTVEYIYGTTKGLYFGKIQQNNLGAWDFQQHTNEHYFEQENVLCFFEYELDKFVVCVETKSMIQVFDRKRKKVIREIENPASINLFPLSLHVPYPFFSMETLPFVFIRDHKSVSIIDLKHYRAYSLLNNVCVNNLFNSPSTVCLSIHQQLSDDDLLLMRQESIKIKKESSTDIVNGGIKDKGGFFGLEEEEEVLKIPMLEEYTPTKSIKIGEEMKYTIELNVIEHVEGKDTQSTKVVKYHMGPKLLDAMKIINRV